MSVKKVTVSARGSRFTFDHVQLRKSTKLFDYFEQAHRVAEFQTWMLSPNFVVVARQELAEETAENQQARVRKIATEWDGVSPLGGQHSSADFQMFPMQALSLTGNSWLTDRAIDCALTNLFGSCEHPPPGIYIPIGVLSDMDRPEPELCDYLEQRGTKWRDAILPCVRAHLEQYKYSDIRFVCFAQNVRGNHWSLVVCSLEDGAVYTGQGMGFSGDPARHHVEAKRRVIFEALATTGFNCTRRPLPIERMEAFPVQRDGYSCGPAVVAATAEFLVKMMGLPIPGGDAALALGAHGLGGSGGRGTGGAAAAAVAAGGGRTSGPRQPAIADCLASFSWVSNAEDMRAVRCAIAEEAVLRSKSVVLQWIMHTRTHRSRIQRQRWPMYTHREALGERQEQDLTDASILTG
jgi:hypothetical protein